MDDDKLLYLLDAMREKGLQFGMRYVEGSGMYELAITRKPFTNLMVAQYVTLKQLQDYKGGIGGALYLTITHMISDADSWCMDDEEDVDEKDRI